MMLGGGRYKFSKDMLNDYRQAAVHPKQGPALAKAINAAEREGLTLGGVHYKKNAPGL